MDVTELQALIRMLEEAGIQSIEITSPAGSLRLVLDGGAADATGPEQKAEGHVAAAPLCGLFCRRHPGRPEPMVEEGAHVHAGDVLGLLRIGPLYAPVTASEAGIVRVLAAADTVVGFGTPLFAIETLPPAA